MGPIDVAILGRCHLELWVALQKLLHLRGALCARERTDAVEQEASWPDPLCNRLQKAGL